MNRFQKGSESLCCFFRHLPVTLHDIGPIDDQFSNNTWSHRISSLIDDMDFYVRHGLTHGVRTDVYLIRWKVGHSFAFSEAIHGIDSRFRKYRSQFLDMRYREGRCRVRDIAKVIKIMSLDILHLQQDGGYHRYYWKTGNLFLHHDVNNPVGIEKSPLYDHGTPHLKSHQHL